MTTVSDKSADRFLEALVYGPMTILANPDEKAAHAGIRETLKRSVGDLQNLLSKVSPAAKEKIELAIRDIRELAIAC